MWNPLLHPIHFKHPLLSHYRQIIWILHQLHISTSTSTIQFRPHMSKTPFNNRLNFIPPQIGIHVVQVGFLHAKLSCPCPSQYPFMGTLACCGLAYVRRWHVQTSPHRLSGWYPTEQLAWGHRQTMTLHAWVKESSFTTRIIVAYNFSLRLMLTHHCAFQLDS